LYICFNVFEFVFFVHGKSFWVDEVVEPSL
jgi:hypothetical protein